MGDPDFILSLKAVSKEAKSAFRDPHNANRLVSPESSDVQNDVYSSGRETTPFNLTEDDDPRLRLTFSQRPNHMGRGFTFSNDAKRCDVYIGKEDARRNRFSVAFDHQQRITLTDYSRSGIYVTYNGQGTRRPRRDFTWILFPEFQPIVLKIMRRDGQHFEVQVELPTHDSDSAEYQANISSFVKEGEEANPPLSLLTLHSRETVEAPIVTLFPRHRPQYYRICAIGGGEYGTVNKAIDVTSGKLVASKIFHKGNWKREVEIMKEMEHDHIIEFFEFIEEIGPELIMDYYSLGNLEDQHKSKPFDRKEVLFIVLQGLDALKYIHEGGLIHRDLKPQNILMETRDPIKIRIADFGLSMDVWEPLQAFAGTHYYAALEIYRLPREYTPAVDIWSLGIVGYQYTVNFEYLLPFEPLTWFTKLSQTLREHRNHPVIEFLSYGMLKFDHKLRDSAEVCHQYLTDTCYEVWPPDSDEASTTSSDASVSQQDESADDGAASHEVVEPQADENQPQAHVPSIEASESKTVGPVENATASNDTTNPHVKGRTSTKRQHLTSLPVEADAEEVYDAESDRTIRPRKVPKRRRSI